MATKAKRTQSVKLPKVGDVVTIRWRDSGMQSDRGGHAPSEVFTEDSKTRGLVTFVSDEDIVLTYCGDTGNPSPGNDGHWAIWIPSIIALHNFGKEPPL